MALSRSDQNASQTLNVSNQSKTAQKYKFDHISDIIKQMKCCTFFYQYLKTSKLTLKRE